MRHFHFRLRPTARTNQGVGGKQLPDEEAIWRKLCFSCVQLSSATRRRDEQLQRNFFFFFSSFFFSFFTGEFLSDMFVLRHDTSCSPGEFRSVAVGVCRSWRHEP
ncbi:hypothetical protein F2P81_009738 [Scophthalmus maximus]|uniref:Uncharacterized protein n=1 Tax=Scophthalmus maximus TaxID=52904 RepID=A0A6A4T0T1_SCOMX|nr:hypothetical protein F2P81_009738 [Scophthalmus maximus]